MQTNSSDTHRNSGWKSCGLQEIKGLLQFSYDGGVPMFVMEKKKLKKLTFCDIIFLRHNMPDIRGHKSWTLLHKKWRPAANQGLSSKQLFLPGTLAYHVSAVSLNFQ